MDPADLERIVDGALRALPAPRAPRTLLPRVMAAVDASARRPWYSRAWLTWPGAWQAASVVVLLAAVGGAAVLLPRVQEAMTALTFLAGVLERVAATARHVEGATTAVRVLWDALLAPIVPYAFGLVLLMCAACAVFGAALNLLVFGKALR